MPGNVPMQAPPPAPGKIPLVLVMVGTDHHPFNRLVEWTDTWLRAQPAGSVRMITQHGRTGAPDLAEGRDFIPRAELDELLADADVVVCHGGPSTIVETRRRGLVPIVVARTSAFGEHVDDHQQRFATVMATRGVIHLVDRQPDLLAAIDAAITRPFTVAGGAAMADPAESARKLGKLVDELVGRRKPHRRPWWRRPAR